MKKIVKVLIRILIVLFILLNIVTAFHAYKFSHFYNAGTVAIKKKELKSGYDISKEILLGINAIKQQNDAPDSNFETIYLTTSNHLKLQGWYVKTDSLSKGTVILFHGHGAKKSAVKNEAAGFRLMGYNTLLLDFRAHGSSEGNTCTIGYKESEDVKLAYDFIKEKGEKNIVLWGISMGAAAVTKAINDYQLQPSKVILEMSFASIKQAAEGRIKMMHLPAEPLSTLVTFWGGTLNGFWSFSMKPSEYVKNIHCPVLVQWGKNDPRVKQEETDLIFANIPGQKKLVQYDNSGHQSLCINEKEKWMAEVQNFMKQ